MKHLRSIRTKVVLLALVAVGALSVLGGRPGVGNLYYDGVVVRTVVPPAAMKKTGTDALYVVVEGVSEQLPVAAVAPGDPDYHGGKWAVNVVEWTLLPVNRYALTSEADVLEAQSDGDVTITRDAAADFKCPIQP